MHPETVHIYLEYADDLPYGEQTVVPFADPEIAKAYLKQRVETVFQKPWDQIAIEDVGPDDTFRPDYVSIDDGARCRFFSIKAHSVLTAMPEN